MREKDKVIFQEAATKFNYWILVRRTNVASLAYIGKDGYTPKPFECKAKTADYNSGTYQTAGLVVDPNIHPHAFKSGKSADVMKYWNDTKTNQPPFSVDTDTKSKHYGCLKYEGKYIHGDYDLYDIIDADNPERNLGLVSETKGYLHIVGPYLKKVADYINHRIGAPVIRHGGEYQYKDHSNQSIDVFKPKGHTSFTILNEYSIREWYRKEFKDRKPITPGKK